MTPPLIGINKKKFSFQLGGGGVIEYQHSTLASVLVEGQIFFSPRPSASAECENAASIIYCKIFRGTLFQKPGIFFGSTAFCSGCTKKVSRSRNKIVELQILPKTNERICSFFRRICGSTILVRDLLTFSM